MDSKNKKSFLKPFLKILRKEELITRFNLIVSSKLLVGQFYYLLVSLPANLHQEKSQARIQTHRHTSAYVSSFIAGVEGIDGGLERVTRGVEEGARSAAVRSRGFIMRENEKGKKVVKIKKGEGARKGGTAAQLFKLRGAA